MTKPYTPRDRDNRAHTKGQKDGANNKYDRPYRHNIFESDAEFKQIERANRPYDKAWNDAFNKRK